MLVLAVLLALATGLMLVRGRAGGVRCSGARSRCWGSSIATYLAGRLNFGESDNVAGVLGVPLRRRRADRRRLCSPSGDGIRPARSSPRSGSSSSLHVVDLVAGARLELNTVFGYSATIGIRVSGQGNLTFAQLTAAVMLLAGLLVWRRPGRRTVLFAIGMLAVTLLVMAAPPCGGDFGAAIAGAPGFALLAWLLLGRRCSHGPCSCWRVLLVAAGSSSASSTCCARALSRPTSVGSSIG